MKILTTIFSTGILLACCTTKQTYKCEQGTTLKGESEYVFQTTIKTF